MYKRTLNQKFLLRTVFLIDRKLENGVADQGAGFQRKIKKGFFSKENQEIYDLNFDSYKEGIGKVPESES